MNNHNTYFAYMVTVWRQYGCTIETIWLQYDGTIETLWSQYGPQYAYIFCH